MTELSSLHINVHPLFVTNLFLFIIIDYKIIMCSLMELNCLQRSDKLSVPIHHCAITKDN